MAQFGNAFYSTFRPQPYNSNLKWEQTTTLNAGLDYGLFNNRLTGSVDLYKRTTRIYCCTLKPIFLWFSNYDNYNVGTIENKGIELLAEVIPVRTQDFEWTIGGNVTKILKSQS
jgi:iron complex outermembrane receptor protein